MSAWRDNCSGGSMNVGNHIGSKPSTRQSTLFRKYESGNPMKELLGQGNLAWDTSKPPSSQPLNVVSGREREREAERDNSGERYIPGLSPYPPPTPKEINNELKNSQHSGNGSRGDSRGGKRRNSRNYSSGNDSAASHHHHHHHHQQQQQQQSYGSRGSERDRSTLSRAGSDSLSLSRRGSFAEVHQESAALGHSAPPGQNKSASYSSAAAAFAPAPFDGSSYAGGSSGQRVLGITDEAPRDSSRVSSSGGGQASAASSLRLVAADAMKQRFDHSRRFSSEQRVRSTQPW